MPSGHTGRKVIFNVANFFIIVLGVAIVILGLLSTKNDSDLMSAELNNELRRMPYTVMVFGACVAGVGALGMISVNCDIKLLSLLYKIALIVAGALMILLGTAAFVMVAVLNVMLKAEMVEMMKDDTKREKMDLIEKANHCCGVEGHMNIYDDKPRYPASCCSTLGIINLCVQSHAYTRRCNQVWTTRRDEMIYYGGIAFIFVGGYCVLLAILVHWAEKRYYVPND